MSVDLFGGAASGVSTYQPPPPRLESGSPQQDDVWATLLGSDAHLVVEARAGTGKSSTSREGMHRLMEADPGLHGRLSYVAFNRAIADEFQTGLPSGATATTMHSAGYAALRRAFPALGEIEKGKLRRIANALLPRYDATSRRAKTAAIRLAECCKSQLLGCDVRSQRYGPLRDMLYCLASRQGIDLREIDRTVLDLVPQLLQRALKETGTIDFGDMTWLPVMLELEFPEVDLLFVDEAQDLDPCQHSLVARMAGDGRMVVVGDPRQAIYAFRGADRRSMGTLADQLARTRRDVERLPLTATRRCPVSHVDLARKIVPDFESLPGAKHGRWEKDVESSEVVEPGWLVLCRKNAPLLSLAFKTAARGTPVAVQGRDLGEGLARFVDDLEATTVLDLLRKLETYRSAELGRLSELDDVEEEVALVNDRCACIHASAQGCASPMDVTGKIRGVFKDVAKSDQSKLVLCSSVHRAKGREAERVAIVEPEGMPSPFARGPEAIEQELNILYVAITRSKHRLSFLGPLPTPLTGA